MFVHTVYRKSASVPRLRKQLICAGQQNEKNLIKKEKKSSKFLAHNNFIKSVFLINRVNGKRKSLIPRICVADGRAENFCFSSSFLLFFCLLPLDSHFATKLPRHSSSIAFLVHLTFFSVQFHSKTKNLLQTKFNFFSLISKVDLDASWFPFFLFSFFRHHHRQNEGKIFSLSVDVDETDAKGCFRFVFLSLKH